MCRIKVQIASWIVLVYILDTSNGAPLTLHNYAPAHEYKPSDYSFSYGVKDLHTGDVKHQWEKKDGDKVTGHYSVLEPDGSTRTVHYTADDKHGFNAVVKHDIPSHHPITPVKPPTSHSNLVLNQHKGAKQDYTFFKDLFKTEYEYKYPRSHSEVQTNKGLDNEDHITVEYRPHHRLENDNTEVVESTYVYIPQEELTQDTSSDFKENLAATGNRYQNNHQSHQYEANHYETDVRSDIKLKEIGDLDSLRSTGTHYPNYITHPKESQIVSENIKQLTDLDGYYEDERVKSSQTIDLSLLSGTSDKIPVDVSQLSPVKIDLTKPIVENTNEEVDAAPETAEEHIKYSVKDKSVQPAHELTQEEVGKYLNDYYKTSQNEPLYEGGFKPITSKPFTLITQPMIPQTYTSNKKPITTPGLRNFASKGTNNKYVRNGKYNNSRYPTQKVLNSIQYPGAGREELRRESHKAEYTRLYRSTPINRGLVRYAKHIRYDD